MAMTVAIRAQPSSANQPAVDTMDSCAGGGMSERGPKATTADTDRTDARAIRTRFIGLQDGALRRWAWSASSHTAKAGEDRPARRAGAFWIVHQFVHSVGDFPHGSAPESWSVSHALRNCVAPERHNRPRAVHRRTQRRSDITQAVGRPARPADVCRFVNGWPRQSTAPTPHAHCRSAPAAGAAPRW